MRVLIVDDDPVCLAFLESALEAQGHEVTTVTDGEKAWLSILTGGFHFVISDWNLPGQSGIELCSRLRLRRAHAYTYFILITSYQGHEKLGEAMDAGVDDFLTKPLDLDALTVRMRVAARILDFHRQIDALKNLLPICMYCKKIRKDQDYWENVETFFTAHAGADFTHALCPDCLKEKIQPELDAVHPAPPSAPDPG
jgi:phosphoserine phosphatase RsbU/P